MREWVIGGPAQYSQPSILPPSARDALPFTERTVDDDRLAWRQQAMPWLYLLLGA